MFFAPKLREPHVGLSEGEFNEIGRAFRSNSSYELFLRKLEYRGIILLDEGLIDSPAREFGQIKNQVPEENLTVTLDTTTIFNALYCVGLQPNVNPIALLDLSVLTFAALCFDRIIVHRYPDIFIVMNYPNKEFVSSYLHSLRADIGNERQSINVSGYTDAWTKLLKKNPGEIVLDLNTVNRYHASPHYWDGVYVGSYLSRHFYNVNSSGYDNELNEFLSIETSCVLFNDSLAGALNLPYQTSSFRNCVYSEILSRKIRGPLSDASDDVFKRPHVLDVVLRESAPGTYGSSSEEKSLFTDYFSAPFLLGIVLEKMKKPEDYWPILLDYRNQLAPLRRKIWEDRDKWQGRETGYARELLKPLLDLRNDKGINLDDAKDVVRSSVALAYPLPTAKGIDVNLVSLALKLMKLLKPYALKYFKPELYALYNLSDEAQRLREMGRTIERIWGAQWAPGSIVVLEHLGSLHS